ncbi:hypothetical protein JV46_15250 [Solemya velum gill symbiont]|uniref:Uncharacterized protein n=1 Tax=Solemya velum gill symbiont TaxID=2340 RepID=A0A0B0HFD0_SOVGS|nr:hypothetical protein JV46_15250 [Solemya velum gill symbiont]
MNDLERSIVDEMIGKKLMISGMAIEVISDAGDLWETRNITTSETVFFNKSVLQNAIKLGKAEEISESDNN